MKAAPVLLLCVATAIFIAAASMAKAWALTPGLGRLAATLLLYTAGNVLMLLLVRDVGMAVAFSLSAVLQLVAVNLVAVIAFGERLGAAQGVGVALAVLATALMTLGPRPGS